jgi:protein-tyrosine phosphatase
MIDFHCHILPGLDDGPVSVDESIAMARSLADFGYTTVCCTPHCLKGYYDLTAENVREATLMLQADLDNAEIQLDLWPGMEYCLDEHLSDFADDLLPLGDTGLVLCEAPQQAHPGIVQEGLELIIDKGYVPLIAHPERTEYFYEKLSRRVAGDVVKDRDAGRGTRNELKPIKSKGLFSKIWPFASRVQRSAPHVHEKFASRVPRPSFPEICLFQANLGSFTGYYGDSVQHHAYRLLKLGVYSGLASDLHDGGSAGKILQLEKFETNPLLKKLAEWDGAVPMTAEAEKSREGEQIGLF